MDHTRMEASSTTKMEDWKATEFPLQVGIGNHFPSVHIEAFLLRNRERMEHMHSHALFGAYTLLGILSNLFIAFTNCEGSINAIKIMGVKERRWGIARASRIQKVRLLLLNFNYKEGG